MSFQNKSAQSPVRDPNNLFRFSFENGTVNTFLPNNSSLYKVLAMDSNKKSPTSPKTKIPVPTSENNDNNNKTSNSQSPGSFKNESSLFKSGNFVKNNNFIKNEHKNMTDDSGVVTFHRAPKPLKSPVVKENVQEENFKKVVLRTQSSPCKANKNSWEEKPPLGQKNSNVVNSGDGRWKTKYEESEKRRKELLTQSEKVGREKDVLEKRMKKLEEDYKLLSSEHQENLKTLNELKTVSRKVYEDYDKLNNKYDAETTALHKALGIASKWYKQNVKLKRQSLALSQNGAQIDELDGDDIDDNDEIEELRKTVKELSDQVGELKAELNKARLQEFEAQEQTINLTQSLEEERALRQKTEDELKELRILREKFESVTYIVKDEMTALRQERDKATEDAKRLKVEANQAQKERNVLAHQSSLLMGEIASNETLMKVVTEVEQLKRLLEEEQQKHSLEVQQLLEKLEDRESEAQLELIEEKLKLAETELELALQRAEQAERSQTELKSKVGQLEAQLNMNTSECAMPPPPPPPPLPPPMPFCNPPQTIKLATKKTDTSKEQKEGERDSLTDMANILGIQRTPKPNNPPGGAIDDIINEIKGGRFVLKATERQQAKREEPPPAVKEMLDIIGTLKRRPRNSRPPPADVQL